MRTYLEHIPFEDYRYIRRGNYKCNFFPIYSTSLPYRILQFGNRPVVCWVDLMQNGSFQHRVANKRA